MNRYLLRCVLALLASLLAGCSSFDSHWKEAAQGKGNATRWDGRWTSGERHESDGSPHGGRLRCVLEPQKAERLTAYFHANWLIFSGNFTMTLEPVPAGPRRQNARKYRGTHDLPAMFGGTYHYDATIAGDHLTAHYTSSYDNGTFLLQRVILGKDCRPPHAKH